MNGVKATIQILGPEGPGALVVPGSPGTVVVAPGTPARAILATIGVQGPPGPGADLVGFTFNQTVPAAEWIVNHNLGRRPSAEIRDAGGVVVEAEIVHVSDNQLRVYFAAAFTGSARCL